MQVIALSSAEAHEVLADLWLQSRHRRGVPPALAHAELAARLDPSFTNLVVLLRAMGQPDGEAAASIEEALETFRAWYELARAAYDEGNLGRARDAIHRAQNLSVDESARDRARMASWARRIDARAAAMGAENAGE